MSNKESESSIEINQVVTIEKGVKKSRNELRLPSLYYVSIIDWEKKLGRDTLFYWLKLLTLVDRTDEAVTKYGNKSTVPRSLRKIMNEFGLSKSTFYRKLVRPLWEYGFIDVVTWHGSGNEGNKPKNIVVYEYPQNEFHLAVKPLQKLRDYERDYNSKQAILGRMGGNKRKKIQKHNNGEEKNQNEGGFKNETPPVTNIKPALVSQIKPINYTNSNLIEEKELINNTYKENFENKHIEDTLESIQFDRLIEHLKEYGWHMSQINAIVSLLKRKRIISFTPREIDRQIAHMNAEIKKGTLSFSSDERIARYFVNGLVSLMKQSEIVKASERLQIIENQLRIERKAKRDTSVYYNWLEE